MAAASRSPRRSVVLPIYLDNHATTRVDPSVVDAMAPFWSDDYGNAASHSHVFGWRAEAAVEQARERLAAAIGADPREITWTSGATESNNLALLGVLRAARAKGRDHVVTVETEHRAVLDPVSALEREGSRVTRLPVDAQGLVDPAAVEAVVDERTALVSVKLANNEIGVLQPLGAIGEICRVHGIPLHTDAAQALGKIPFDVDSLGVDLASFSAHKLYGPKGIGALYVRRRRPRQRIEPLLYGGGHERSLRSGTLPVPLVVGFGRAAELADLELEAEGARVGQLRQRLGDALGDALDGVRLNGHPERRLPGNLNLAFDGVAADALIVELRDVALSTGSACSSAEPEPSHVLRALGLPEERVRGSLRIGIGRFNTEAEIDWVSGALIEAVERLREARRPQPAQQPVRA